MLMQSPGFSPFAMNRQDLFSQPGLQKPPGMQMAPTAGVAVNSPQGLNPIAANQQQKMMMMIQALLAKGGR